MNLEIILFLSILVLAILIIFVFPIFTIISMNNLFKTNIKITFKNWLSMIWLQSIVKNVIKEDVKKEVKK